MKKLFIMLLVLGAMWSVTGCNMFRGAGEDLEEAGDAVKDATN